MEAVLDAYDLRLGDLPWFYNRLNEEISYPEGMVTCLGAIYWGKPDNVKEIVSDVPAVLAGGVRRFSELLEAIRTPARMKKFIGETGVSPKILRILKHDIELWLPKPVPLAVFGPFLECPEFLARLESLGLTDQLKLISACQTVSLRAELADRIGIPLEVLAELVRICDAYRMGSNLDHIRARIYYQMGWVTWQKWAESTPEQVIAAFSDYIQSHELELERLVPWPKEVRNSIEWAKLHLQTFEVEW